MVKVKVWWKIEYGWVYIKFYGLGKLCRCYRFSKISHNKRFHPRQCLTRLIDHNTYHARNMGPDFPLYVGSDDWKETAVNSGIIKKAFGISILTELDFYDNLCKAC